MFKIHMEKIEYSDLDLFPSAKNACDCANFAITKPYTLDQEQVDKIIKMIKQTFKHDNNAKVSYHLLLQMQISLDAYGFKYDKNFLDEKAVDNLNSIYTNLLGSNQYLSKNAESIYKFHLEIFNRNSSGIDNKIKNKILCNDIDEKTLE